MITRDNNFPEYMQDDVKICRKGHAYALCGVKLKGCPVCKRHGEVEKQMTNHNKGMTR